MAENKTYQTTRLTLGYYTARPGQLIHYADAASDLGIPKERVGAALHRSVTVHPEMGITREGQVGYYVYRKPSEIPAQTPTAPVLPELWEELGKLGDRILVRNSLNQIKFLADE